MELFSRRAPQGLRFDGIPRVDGVVFSAGLTEPAAINHWVEQE